MQPLSAGILKKIRRYSKARAGGNIHLSFPVLKKTFKKASPDQRRLYESEMDDYLNAVKGGVVKAGESIIMSAFKSKEGGDDTSDGQKEQDNDDEGKGDEEDEERDDGKGKEVKEKDEKS